jgi:hypothetical protein
LFALQGEFWSEYYCGDMSIIAFGRNIVEVVFEVDGF